jgi:hypothetical protein
MKIQSTICVLAVGFIIGAISVLSCGDDNPKQADAATTCDCPASEPPLSGRITRATRQRAFTPMGYSNVIATCESGSIALSGGCFANSTDSKYVLNSSYPYSTAPDAQPSGWSCDYYNGTASPVTSTAYVTCLKPAP